MKSRYFNFMLMELKKIHLFYWQVDVKHENQRREIWEQCKEFSKNEEYFLRKQKQSLHKEEG